MVTDPQTNTQTDRGDYNTLHCSLERSVTFSAERQGLKTTSGPLVVHCFCVYRDDTLLGDLLGVSRSMEINFGLLLYHTFLFSVYLPYCCSILLGISLLRLSYLVFSVLCRSCFGLVVSTCQVIGYRKTPLMTPL